MLVVPSASVSQRFVLLAARCARWNIWVQLGCVGEQKKPTQPSVGSYSVFYQELGILGGGGATWNTVVCDSYKVYTHPLLVVKLQFCAVSVFLLRHVALPVGCGFPEAPSR